MRINNVGNYYGSQKENSRKKANNNYSGNNTSFEAYKLIGKFKDPNYTWIDNFVYELSNKLKVIIVPKPGKDAISIKGVIKVGAMNEQDKLRGISHFHEHLAFDGYDAPGGLKPGEFDKIAESKGADSNAFTSYEKTSYIINASDLKDKDINELIKIQSQMIKNMKTPKEPYVKEQEIVIQEIKQYKDDSMSCMDSVVIKNLFGINSTSKDLVLGKEQNIRKITQDDVLKYHNMGYSPDNIELHIAGKVKPEKIIKYVDKHYDTSDFRPKNIPIHYEDFRITNEPKISFITGPKIKNSFISVGMAGPENINQCENTAAEALLNILCVGKHSRLNKKMLELNSKFSPMLSTISSKPTHPQMFYFQASVDPGEEQKVLSLFKDTILELKDKPINDEELLIAKNGMLDLLNSSAESSDGITGLLADFSTRGGVDAYANYANNIRALTIEDVNSVVRKYMDPNKVGIAILQPKNNINKNISFNGNLISPKAVKKYVLPNNVNVIINDVSDKIRSAASFTLESEIAPKPAVGEVLTKLLQNSTAKYSEDEFALHKAKEGVTNLTLIEISNGLMFSSESANEFLPAALKIMKEMIFEPQINEQNFNKAKSEIKVALKALPQTADDRAYEQAYGRTYNGFSSRVLNNEIDNVTLQDVQEHYNNIIKNTRGKVVITGPISKMDGLDKNILDELVSIKHIFSKSKIKETAIDLPKENITIVQPEKGVNQSHIVQLFPIKAENIEDKAAFTVLNAILGAGMTSRIFLDLREKQKLAYQAGSKFINNAKFCEQLFIIKTGIKNQDKTINDNIEKSIKGFDKHLKLLIKTLPSDEELSNAKKIIFSNFDSIFATSGGQNAAILKGLSTKDGALFYNKLANAIKKVTAQDVQNVAKKYLTKPSVTSILTSKEAIKKSEPFLKSRGEYKYYPNDL